MSAIGAFLLGWWSTIAFSVPLYRYARGRLLDHPNARSSHHVPKPRGGGLAVVLTVVFGTSLFGGELPLPLLAALGGSLFLAVGGWLDDHRALPIALKLSLQLFAAFWALFWLSFWTPLGLWKALLLLGVLLWGTNLYNFMDGIDGLAASQAFLWSLVLALLAKSPFTPLLMLFSGALLGFLLWNWPPAKIFMGDVGSQFLGFLMTLIFVTLGLNEGAFWWSGAIITALFWVEATWTLLYRFGTGQKWFLPHRSHAYQKLARKWGHLPVTVLYLGITLFWLLPWALLSYHAPSSAMMECVVAIIPIVLFVIDVRAGQPEEEGNVSHELEPLDRLRPGRRSRFDGLRVVPRSSVSRRVPNRSDQPHRR